MIRFIVARHKDDVYNRYLHPSLVELAKTHCDIFACYDVADKEGQKETIFTKYNNGVKAALKECAPEDIIVFIHEDVRIEDPFFIEKLITLFSKKPQVGVVGVVGTIELTQRGGWWMHAPQMLRGHVMQEMHGETKHLVKGVVGYFDDVVAVDGLMMAVRPAVFETIRFDDDTFKGNDFYDVQLCVDALAADFKIAVADILLHHASPGMGVFTNEWEEARKAMVARYEKMGFTFPIRCLTSHNVVKSHAGEVEV